jgi:sigma-E factor negative regulatory protein RseC
VLRESGRVVAQEANAVWVETVRTSACGRCAARAGCGHGALAGVMAGSGKGMIRVRDGEALAATDCRIDDTVEIELPESAVLRASAMIYGLPLLAGIAGAVLLAPFGELQSLLGFGSGLGCGFFIANTLTRRAAQRIFFEPRLVRRLATPDELIVSTAVP